MDNGFTTKQWKHGRLCSSITCNNIVLWKNCDLEWFQIKSQNFKSNPNKSHVFQIKSLFFKSNHYVWFNHDLNQIMIWICPSLVPILLYFATLLWIKRKLVRLRFRIQNAPKEGWLVDGSTDSASIHMNISGRVLKMKKQNAIAYAVDDFSYYPFSLSSYYPISFSFFMIKHHQNNEL